MKKTGKLLAILLALAMLLGMFPAVGDISARAEEEGPIASITAENVSVPEYTGGNWNTEERDGEIITYYCYYAHSTSYTITFNDGREPFTGDENDVIEEFGESIELDYSQDPANGTGWEAGNTYTVGMTFMGVTGSYTYTIEPGPIRSVTINTDTVEIVEKTRGYYNQDAINWNSEEGEWEYSDEYYYYYDFRASYTVTFRDFSTKTVTGDFEYDGVQYLPEYITDQSYDNQWAAGSAHTVTMRLGNTVNSFTVNIVENPVKSVSAVYTVTENTNGEWTNKEWDPLTDTYVTTEDYFRYDKSNDILVTIVFKDGTSITDGLFNIGDMGYVLYCDTDQTYENRWLPNHTYTRMITCNGVEGMLTVTVKEGPVASVTAEDITIPAYTNGYWGTYEKEGEIVPYYHYLPNSKQYTVTLKSGEVFSGTEYEIYQQFGERINYDYNQRPEAGMIWEEGKTYEVAISFMGAKGSYRVAVEPSPIKSVTLNTPSVEILENTHGNTDRDWIWNPETGEEEYSEEYFYYREFPVSYTVTFKDGTVQPGTGNGFFDKNGVRYDVAFETDQSYENRWTVGSAHTVTMRLGSTVNSFTVSIVENPVKSVSAVYTVVENTNGEWTNLSRDEETGSYVTTEEYFSYYINADQLFITLELKDSSVITGSCRELEKAGYDFWVTDQTYATRWLPNQTNTCPIRCGTVEGEITVTIVKNPIASISTENFSIPAYTNGFWSAYEKDGEEISYFTYYADAKAYTVTFNDGREPVTLTDSQLYEEFGDYVWTYNTQDPSRGGMIWEPGGTYQVTVEFLGVRGTYWVTIEESPIVSVTVNTPVLEIYEKACGSYETETYNELTGEWEECEPFFIYSDLPITYTVKLRDGTEITKSGAFSYDGVWYNPDYESTSGQSFDNQWTVGNTYPVTMHLGEAGCEFSVKIVESPVKSIYAADVTIPANEGGWESGSMEEFFYYYDLGNLIYRITYKDGTILEKSGYEIYEETGYGIIFQDTQREEHWQPGNTYSVTYSYLGAMGIVKVTVSDGLVSGITAEENVTLYEQTGGYWGYEYDEETGEVGESFYYYYNFIPALTVTFADGKTAVLNAENNFSCQISGITYYAEAHAAEDQTYETAWEVGKTYKAVVTFLNASTEFYVTVAESPVKELRVEPLTLLEKADGYYSYDDHDNEVFYYEKCLTGVVELKDGTELPIQGEESKYYHDSYVVLNGRKLYLQIQSDQYAGEPWGPGEHTMKVLFGGASCEIIATVVPTAITADITGDGKTDLKDVSFLFRWWTGGETLTGEQLAIADVTGDGLADIRDAAALYKNMIFQKQD